MPPVEIAVQPPANPPVSSARPEVPIPPAGYRLLNLCPRLFVHDDIEGAHESPPEIEYSVHLPPDVTLTGAPAEHMRQPLQDDRFYAPAGRNGQLGFFVLVPVEATEITILISWRVTVPGHQTFEALHAMVLHFADGAAEPVFYQDAGRLPGPVIYSTGDAGFLRQDRSTALLVPTTILRRGDLPWRDEAIVSKAPDMIELFDDITLKPIDTRDFLTWTTPELTLQPHEHDAQPNLSDPAARATHYANASLCAGPDGMEVLTQAVREAGSIPWPLSSGTEPSPHPSIERLCAWWNTLRPSGTSPAEGLSIWVRLDDAGGYWDAAGRAPNIELEIPAADRSSAVAFGDAILVFFCLSKSHSLKQGGPADTEVTQYLASGQPFWTISANSSIFDPDENAVLALSRLPALLPEK